MRNLRGIGLGLEAGGADEGDLGIHSQWCCLLGHFTVHERVLDELTMCFSSTCARLATSIWHDHQPHSPAREAVVSAAGHCGSYWHAEPLVPGGQGTTASSSAAMLVPALLQSLFKPDFSSSRSRGPSSSKT